MRVLWWMALKIVKRTSPIFSDFFARETTRCDEARFSNHARRRVSGWWRDVSDRAWPERRWSLLLIVDALFRGRRCVVPGTSSALPFMEPKMVRPIQSITLRWRPRLGNEQPGGIIWCPARSVERPSDGGFLRGARLVPPTPPRRESVAWSQRVCTPPAACGPSSRRPRWRWRPAPPH